MDFALSSSMIPKRIARTIDNLRLLLLRQLAPRRLRPLVSLLTRKATREACARRSPDSFSSIVRLYAHAVEKSVHAPIFDPQRGVERYERLKLLLADEMGAFLDLETLRWARNMLDLYEHRRKFPISATQVSEAPPRPSLDITTLEAFFLSRRSVRTFEATCVSTADFLRAVDAMRWAPTSCHRQAVKVFATLDPQRAKQAHACCVGRSGFGEHIPAFAAFCADSNAYGFPEECFLPYVDSAICFSFFLLAAHALGVTAVPMAWNQGCLDAEARIRGLLRIPDEFVIGLNCALGVAGTRSPGKPRKPVSAWCEIVA